MLMCTQPKILIIIMLTLPFGSYNVFTSQGELIFHFYVCKYYFKNIINYKLYFHFGTNGILSKCYQIKMNDNRLNLILYFYSKQFDFVF